jgi:hypothetical protein
MDHSTLYDVIEIDWDRSRSLIASHLAREQAVALARNEAQLRGLGRMFLEGSNEVRGVVGVIPRSRDPHPREH